MTHYHLNDHDNLEPQETKNPVEQTTCCIVGGGPAGAVLALLLARQNIPVVLLEAHLDFDRDFRGDTLHASVMEIMDELGLAERLLQLRHAKVSNFSIPTRTGPFTFNLFAGLRTKFPYITVMAQSQFLTFITEDVFDKQKARRLIGRKRDTLIKKLKIDHEKARHLTNGDAVETEGEGGGAAAPPPSPSASTTGGWWRASRCLKR